MLGIDCSPESFEKALQEAQLLINFNNDLTLSCSEGELRKLLKDTKIIAVVSHDTPFAAMADLAIPVATASEYGGSIINCDNILQTFGKAVTRNHDPADIGVIAARLGSPLHSGMEQFAELKKYITILKDFEADTIPAEGLKLNDSEAANVTA
jgi:NADH-quinone oxidoreductase subunit G